MEKLLKGKTILITGGSSRLGQAFVRKALREGARILLTYHEHEEEVRDFVRDGAKSYRLDLSDMRSIDAVAKQIREETKVLDVLIHNAAAVRDRTISNLSEEEWDLILTVNLKAPYYLTKKMMPLLFKSSPGSKIFFMTSRAAIQGGFGTSNYAASKAGLIGLMKSLAFELGKKNILVNAVNPGFMKSAMTVSLPGAAIEANLKASPLERFSDPEEVAKFLVYLASDSMTQVTGQVFHVDSRKI